MKRKARLGLVTLADLPELKGKGPTTSTIAIARLDNNLKDKRYGSFKITQADVDGWTRNLTETFGGRVAIDADHSSDRGGGTRAMGWITGLHQDGKLVHADVQWTPRGARAIRRGDYRHISPTFVERYRDEHGVDHGRALIGAGLTNRPVLRAGMPCLSLSRDHFDEVVLDQPPADPPSPSRTPSNDASSRPTKSGRTAGNGKKGGKARKSKRKKARKLAATMSLSESFAGLWPELDAFEERRYELEQAAAAKTKTEEIGKLLLDAGMPASEVKTLTAGMAPELAEHFQPRGPAFAYDGRSTIALSRADEQAGIGAGAEPGVRDRIDPDRAALDKSARALAKNQQISYVDAAVALEEGRHLAELTKADGSAEVPWNDTRPLPAGAVDPFNDQHKVRDQRRAEVAGVNFNDDLWKAHALLGRDYVGEHAEHGRHQAVADQQAKVQSTMAEARQRGQLEAALARNARALERQQRQQQRARQAREDQAHGRSVAGNADHTGPTVPW